MAAELQIVGKNNWMKNKRMAQKPRKWGKIGTST